MTAVSSLRYLSLPEEFVLLSYRRSGKVHEIRQTATGCAVAELGELALRRTLLTPLRKKSKMFGLDVYHLNSRVELLHTGPTGLAWGDELVAELEGDRAAAHKPMPVHSWLRRRSRAALALHRNALVEHGLLSPGHSTILRRPRYHPNSAVRDELIGHLRAVCQGESPLDAHMLFLIALVKGAQLGGEFGLSWTRLQKLAVADGVGPAAHLPEDLRDTSIVLGALVPSRENSGSGPA
ncbi:GPP34 family phosphoprotein [Kitasatospora sp. NPDC048296]|uniref:GOLPH3/VPS74 family protein n=1 Tax=Kitasatospora sp. NPDC048296 TaxID=3364048 RepID=UPI00371AB316